MIEQEPAPEELEKIQNEVHMHVCMACEINYECFNPECEGAGMCAVCEIDKEV